MTILYRRSDFTVLGDSTQDKAAWLEARKSILTSSDVFTYRDVGLPDWWSSNRDDIMKEKVLDIGKNFPEADETSMAHGSFDEVNIANKCAAALGCDVQCVNWLCVNDRWPYLGASIDSFIQLSQTREPQPVYCQDRSIPGVLREQLARFDVPLLLEIKKSTSRTWKKAPPDYYANAQVQMQLHILDLPAAVLCAESILDVRHTDAVTRRPYFRRYWDLRPYLVKRDPKWERILDEVNEDFPREWQRWEADEIVEYEDIP